MAGAKQVVNTLLLDSGVLIQAEKDQRVEAVIRKWLSQGATFLIAAPSLTETLRGTPRDAAAQRLINAVGRIEPLSETIASYAGTLLAGRHRGNLTVDAMIVATAVAHNASDIFTTDPHDIGTLAPAGVNVVHLDDVTKTRR